MAQLLSTEEIQARLAQLDNWQLEGKKIKKTFTFADFVTAIDFVNKLVIPAIAAAHHPDLKISYQKVTVSITTHDAGGLTEKDFDLAAAISRL